MCQVFKQISTIHAHINIHYIPFVFSLLSATTIDTFISCLKHIREKFKCDFKPTEIIYDFEKIIQRNFIWPIFLITYRKIRPYFFIRYEFIYQSFLPEKKSGPSLQKTFYTLFFLEPSLQSPLNSLRFYEPNLANIIRGAL
jgi:hypothetical protein